MIDLVRIKPGDSLSAVLKELIDTESEEKWIICCQQTVQFNVKSVERGIGSGITTIKFSEDSIVKGDYENSLSEITAHEIEGEVFYAAEIEFHRGDNWRDYATTHVYSLDCNL
jgi:hypothetical protein